MGTRRRMSFDHQNMVIRTMKEVYEQGGYTDNDGFTHGRDALQEQATFILLCNTTLLLLEQ